jgi:hypothetical protein
MAGTNTDAARLLAEVDLGLLEMYRQMTVRERLRAASKSAAVMARLRDAASKDR